MGESRWSLPRRRAPNAVLHGAGGEVLLRTPADGDGPLELLVIDRGPGIADVAKALQDGYSTAGTPGTGLGAAVRMSDTFDLYSAPTTGTVLYARFVPRRQFGGQAGSAGGRLDGLEIGEVCLPIAVRSSAATRGRRNGMATPTW